MFLSCVLIYGCASVPTADPSGRTLIESEPPGARIEIGGQYVGTTPVRVNIPRVSIHQTGNNVVVVANPIKPGQQVQRKVIAYDETTPTHMFFDMNLVTIPNSSTVNLNLASHQPVDNTPPTPEQVKAYIIKMHQEGNVAEESEARQYAKEQGINVE